MCVPFAVDHDAMARYDKYSLGADLKNLSRKLGCWISIR